MKKVLLLSPHFDDAVLSAGQFLAGRPDCDVVTVFAGFPTEDYLTPYDEKCGFKTSKEAVTARRLEDKNALALLKANPIHWKYADSQYSNSFWDIGSSILIDIANIIHDNDYEFVLCPLGIGHGDHKQVSDYVLQLVKEGAIKCPVYLWEDLPTRVVYPEEAFERIQELGLTEREFIGDGPIANKIRSLTCYTSQIGTGILDPYVMYVPERFWRVNPVNNE